MSDVIVEIDAATHVATITLNRPAAYNALTAALLEQLLGELRALQRNERVRALLLTGAGKGFCAGQALDDSATLDVNGRADFRATIEKRYAPIILLLRTMEKPVVAAVNGVAAGAGMALALACDLRVASESATFTTAFAKIGLVADSGLSYLLPRYVGLGKALELVFLSERLSSADALALGLVNRVVPDAEFPSAARALAQTLARGPRSLGLSKAQFERTALVTLEQALKIEADFQATAGATEDFREGWRAFLDKRPPNFSGR